MNSFILMGRIVKDIKLEKDKEGINWCRVVLAITRPVKNDEGLHDTDFIDVILKNGVATNTIKYCKKDDTVGVRGRIERLSDDDMKLVADKLYFIPSDKGEGVEK